MVSDGFLIVSAYNWLVRISEIKSVMFLSEHKNRNYSARQQRSDYMLAFHNRKTGELEYSAAMATQHSLWVVRSGE